MALGLDRAARTDSLVAVLYIDLDRFKDVNDSYGHSTGDALLVAVAEQLVTAVRPGDTVARVGGDAFAVVAEALGGPEEALALAERFLRDLRDENGAGVSASIGVAVRRSGDAADEAMRDADTALYRAKAAGRARVELFDKMRVRMLDRLQTESDLRLALQRDEFDLYYQPIIVLADGSISALEALVRWRHPTRGLLAPGAFIAIAEETHVIMELGRLVIARACADAARWNAMLPDAPPIAVSVNLSPHQLADEGCRRSWRRASRPPASDRVSSASRSRRPSCSTTTPRTSRGCSRSRRWECGCCSTTSAPATPRSATSRRFRSTR